MIVRSTLIIPSEKAPTLLDLKAALLTYDKVNLLDPDDRDLFPSAGMGIALGMPPVISLPSTRPVRRIGKAPGYDDEFSAVVEASKAAVSQGSVSVIRTYNPPVRQVGIGMVDLGGFPLQLTTLLTIFRTAAADSHLQAAAVQKDKWLFEVPERVWAVAEARGSADGGINDDPPLHDVVFPMANEDSREALSNVARARIGHTIKLTGFCMMQGLVPHGVHQWHDSILRRFLCNSAEFIDQVAEVDPYWNYRNRALRLVHDEYLDFARLDQLSVEDVLRLRTEAWGRQAEARDALFDAVGQIARSASEEPDFDKAVLAQVRDYRQKAAEVEDERAALLFKLNCEVGKVALSGAGTVTAGGTIASLGNGIGVAATFVAAAYYALHKYQDLKPIADGLRQAEGEFESDARFGMHNFYDRLP